MSDTEVIDVANWTEEAFRVRICDIEANAGYLSGIMHAKFHYVPIYDKGHGDAWISGFNRGYQDMTRPPTDDAMTASATGEEENGE